MFADGTPKEWKSYDSDLKTRITRFTNGRRRYEDLVSIYGAVEARTTYRYDDGELRSVTGPDGGAVSYQYDPLGRVVQEDYACSGDQIEYEYSAGSRRWDWLQITRVTTRLGAGGRPSSTWTSFDGFGRPVQTAVTGSDVTNPDAGANGQGMILSHTEYDVFGRVVYQSEPMTQVTPLVDYGVRLTPLAQGARFNRYTYTSKDQISSITNHLGEITSYHYLDAVAQEPVPNNPGEWRDVRAITVRQGPDDYGTASIVDYRGRVMRQVELHPADFDRENTEDPDRTIFMFGGLYDNSYVQRPSVTHGYDLKGNLVQVTSGLSHPQDADYPHDASTLTYSYHYDQFGRLTAKKVPGQQYWYRTVYDGFGRVAASQTPDEALAGKHSVYSYNRYNKLQTVGLMDGQPRAINYIPPGNRTNEYRYAFDQGESDFLALTRSEARVLDADGSLGTGWVVEEYTNDAVCGANSAVKTTGLHGIRAGQQVEVEFVRNQENRVVDAITHVPYAGGTIDLTLTSFVSSDRIVDEVDAVLNVNGSRKLDIPVVNYHYDQYGQLTRQRFAQSKSTRRWLQTRNYTYDVKGRLTAINQPLQEESTSNYLVGADNQFQGPKVVYGSAYSTDERKDLFYEKISYDPSQRIVGGAPTVGRHRELIQSAVYAVRGRRPTIETYGYDERLRLNRYESHDAASSGATTTTGSIKRASASYEYDQFARPTSVRRGESRLFYGNRVYNNLSTDYLTYTYAEDPGAGVQKINEASYIYGGHRQDNATAGYVYDAVGRVTFDPYRRLRFTYNILGLTATATVDSGPHAGRWTAYVYTADGQLIRTIEYDADGRVHRELAHYGGFRYDLTDESVYVPLTDGAAMVDLNAAQVKLIGYERDHLGNVILSYTDADNDGWIDLTSSAELLSESRYFPYGLKRMGYTAADSRLPFAYNGAEWDDRLKQHLTTYRSMAPETGLWGQTDPKAEWDYAYSPYAAMRGNPISYSDPDGDIVDPFTLATAVVIGAKAVGLTLGAKIAIGVGVPALIGGGLWASGSLACATCFNTYNPYQLPTAVVRAGVPPQTYAPSPSVPGSDPTFVSHHATRYGWSGTVSEYIRQHGISGLTYEEAVTRWQTLHSRDFRRYTLHMDAYAMWDRIAVFREGLPLIGTVVAPGSGVTSAGTIAGKGLGLGLAPRGFSFTGTKVPRIGDFLSNPSLLSGMHPNDVSHILRGSPGAKNWTIGKSTQGTNAGRAWKMSEMSMRGHPTGQQIRWHPGSARKTGMPYWRVNTYQWKSPPIY